jgi:hypothetical protein
MTPPSFAASSTPDLRQIRPLRSWVPRALPAEILETGGAQHYRIGSDYEDANSLSVRLGCAGPERITRAYCPSCLYESPAGISLDSPACPLCGHGVFDEPVSSPYACTECDYVRDGPARQPHHPHVKGNEQTRYVRCKGKLAYWPYLPFYVAWNDTDTCVLVVDDPRRDVEDILDETGILHLQHAALPLPVCVVGSDRRERLESWRLRLGTIPIHWRDALVFESAEAGARRAPASLAEA